MSTPSSARRRRSRSATSWTSPTRSPSTNVTPASHVVDEPSTSTSQLDDRAVLREQDPVLGDTGLARELCVRSQHPVLAVDRHDVARAEKREHRAQLLLARVAGDVHRRDLLVQHLGAGARELVDRVVDA